MQKNSAEEIKELIEENVRTSYRVRYTQIELPDPKPGSSARREMKIRTDYRADLHDSLSELFTSSHVPFRSHKVSSHSVEVIDIDNKNDKVRILIKPPNGREWRQQSYWNENLEKLSNWNRIRSSPDTRIEFEILRDINAKIHELGNVHPVELIIKSKKYSNIIGFVPGPFGAKADFVGIDKNGNSVLFISHKDGYNARSFQQYSGMSSRAGSSIYDHPEVQKFREDISKKETSDFYNTAYYRPIEDVDLKKKAVFGKDFSSGGTSVNNIDFFCQGRPVLTKRGKSITLSFTTRMAHRTQISQLERSGYTPTLGARRGEAYRTVEYRNDRVTGVRAGIFSEGYIKGRTHEQI